MKKSAVGHICGGSTASKIRRLIRHAVIFSGGFSADKFLAANSAIGGDWGVYSHHTVLQKFYRLSELFVVDVVNRAVFIVRCVSDEWQLCIDAAPRVFTWILCLSAWISHRRLRLPWVFALPVWPYGRSVCAIGMATDLRFAGYGLDSWLGTIA